MRRREFLGLLGAGLVGVLPGPLPATVRRGAARGTGERLVERWSWAMGQPVHLQLFAADEAAGYEAAQAALAELWRVEHALSRFDDSSDLSELNRRAGRRAVRVGPDLVDVLAAALGFERTTAGAFNPSVEPLMRAWGFHAPRSQEPSVAEIAAARRVVQATRVLVDADRVRLPSRESRLDLGGIGVGYGLDRAVAVLRRAGVHRALLDISGDCFALGAPPGEAGWLVGIADPRPGRSVLASTRLRDAALATSSNSVSVVRYGRAVRGHVMDPSTGWPADALAQVSVVARSGLEADALSTAMLVSGTPAPGVLRSFTL
jgi:thiamine biosynthesis lipoprotein